MDIHGDAFDPELVALMVMIPAECAGYHCRSVVSREELQRTLEAAGLMSCFRDVGTTMTHARVGTAGSSHRKLTGGRPTAMNSLNEQSTCPHIWEPVAHIGNLMVRECQRCGSQSRQEAAPEDTLARRLESGFYREQTKADPDMRELALERRSDPQGKR